ncbi:MAG: glycosyltransferase family 2 protein [Candidatus Sungbacteria bacterium]|nr:glycosyltransferase family 2 protein [Candidatus Sungbacteria bacterium]
MQTIDIIIPVHNRPQVLRQALQALARQSMPQSWHATIMVVSDGGSPYIADVAAQAIGQAPATQTIEHAAIPKGGVARARNYGLAISSAPLVMFLGADILLRPKALHSHIYFHLRHPQPEAAALGAVKWDPRLPPSPFMEWMVHGGPQNNFDAILGKQIVNPAQYFFASHISLKRAVLPRQPFSEDFNGYGWEDLDLGERLVKKGLKLHFLSDTIGLHQHAYSASDIYRRQESVGKNFIVFSAKHKVAGSPRLTKYRRFRLMLVRYTGAIWLLKIFLAYIEKTHSFPKVFTWITAFQFWFGLWKAQLVKGAKIGQKGGKWPLFQNK